MDKVRAYACWCQFGYCIPCQQRLPKFRTIFLRMFGTIAQSIICKPELAEYHLGYQMSSDSSGLCEVRVPTFRRPKLLRRALLSVLEQTYSNWRCVVLDDCPDGSARSIVEAIQDHRKIICKILSDLVRLATLTNRSSAVPDRGSAVEN